MKEEPKCMTKEQAWKLLKKQLLDLATNPLIAKVEFELWDDIGRIKTINKTSMEIH